MGMLDEGRWDKPVSAVGTSSVHGPIDHEPADAHLDWIADEIVSAHQDGTCSRCRRGRCKVRTWARAWQAGERRPYPEI